MSTYQRPWHLRRCLTSLAAQRGVAGRFEVIVVDDGSRDETPAVVAQTAEEVDYPLSFITHPHNGFQLARCRNSGIRAARAPYLLFTDGDCIFPLDHLRRHLDARRPGVVRSGDCLRLDEALSQRIDESAARSEQFIEGVAGAAARFRRHGLAKAVMHQALRRCDRPKLTGWNIAAWRDQLVRINGFDERFRGWGCEDDDLAARLRASGARIVTALGYTHGYHLWHPIDATAPTQWSGGANVSYLRRRLRLTRCLAGLTQRTLDDAVYLLASDECASFARRAFGEVLARGQSADLELLFWPYGEGFSRSADCRVLVCRAGDRIPRWIRRRAHSTITVAEWDDPFAVRRQLEGLLGLGQGPATASAAQQDAA